MDKPTQVRFTVSAAPEIVERFKKMADITGMSLSRCVGEWLADTADGADFVLQKMVEAKRQPQMVLREMQAGLHGLLGEIEELKATERKKLGAGGGALSGGAPGSRPRRSPR